MEVKNSHNNIIFIANHSNHLESGTKALLCVGNQTHHWMSFQDPRMGDTPAGPGVGQRSVLKMVLQATASRQLQIEQRE